MVFDPRHNFGGGSQARGTFVYGGGADYPLLRHILLRTQYRGFLYKIPDFETSSLKIDKFTHAAVPSAGIVLAF